MRRLGRRRWNRDRLMKYPKFLFRPDDGFRFTLQSNGKYTMDKSIMKPKYEYTYTYLKSCGFVDSFGECKIKEYISENDGHEEID